jgi:hypothetical protein
MIYANGTLEYSTPEEIEIAKDEVRRRTEVKSNV